MLEEEYLYTLITIIIIQLSRDELVTIDYVLQKKLEHENRGSHLLCCFFLHSFKITCPRSWNQFV